MLQNTHTHTHTHTHIHTNTHTETNTTTTVCLRALPKEAKLINEKVNVAPLY